MPQRTQLRRGNRTSNENFTGAVGEVIYDTTLETIRTQTGAKQGGRILSRLDQSAKRVDTIAALKAETEHTGLRQPDGYHSAFDGVELPPYYADLSDTTSSNNGGSIIVADDGTRWKWVSTPVLIDLRLFGVRFDGSDDTNALINAYAALNNVVFVIPPISVKAEISGTIDLQSDQATIGYGIGGIKQNAAETPIFKGTGLSNVMFDNVVLRGLGTDYDSGWSTHDGHPACGVFLTNCNTVSVRKCKLENFATSGVQCISGDNIDITNNVISGTNGDTATISEPEMVQTGIRVLGDAVSGPVTRINISGNKITECAEAVKLQALNTSSHTGTISRNKIYSIPGWAGIRCALNDLEVTENILRDVQRYAVYLMVEENEVIENMVAASNIVNNADTGIDIDALSDSVTRQLDFSRNIIIECRIGIIVNPTIQGATLLENINISNNIIRNCRNGIDAAQGNPDKYSLTGNRVDNCDGEGIAVGGSNILITGCIINNPSSPSGSAGNKHGIRLHLCSKAIIEDCVVEDTVGEMEVGIVNKSSTNTQIKGCKVVGGTTASLTSDSSPVVLKDTTFDTINNPGNFVGPAFFTDATRPAAGIKGRVIFNDTDGQLNIDDGTNWTLPDGTTT